MDDIPFLFTPSSEGSQNSVLKADFTSLYHEYDVFMEIEKDSKKTQIEYTAGVKYEKSSPSGNSILSIHRLSKTFINKIEPDTIADEISAQVGEIFQPLHLEINLQGEIVKFTGYEESCKKWESIQEELRKIYAGATLESYIKSINQALSSPESLVEKIKNDWFVSLYYVPLYTAYKEPSETEIWKLPSLIEGNKKTTYSIYKSSENLEDKEDDLLYLYTEYR